MFKESAKKTLTTACQCTLNNVTANALIKHLGPPRYDDSEIGIDKDDNPTSMQWVFEDDAENVVSLYDWRVAAAFQKDKPVTWSVGASKPSEAVRFRNWLSGIIHPLAKTDPFDGAIYDKITPGF
jgi:hypothetical protein